MVVRSLWLGVIENKRPDVCQRFFEVDLAPPILGFLSRLTGGCCSDLMDLNVDCKFCTVLLWFSSIPPLLLSVTTVAEYGRAQKDKDIFIEIFGGILVCINISLFFLYGSRVFWKRGHGREYSNMIAELVTVKLSMRVLTAWQALRFLLPTSCSR